MLAMLGAAVPPSCARQPTRVAAALAIRHQQADKAAAKPTEYNRGIQATYQPIRDPVGLFLPNPVMSRFVVLQHQSPRGVHWDFMLQRGGALATWALGQEPVPHTAISAESLADHRLVYLDYEGPISGGRGTVARWDWGTYDSLRWDAEEVVVRLAGVRLCGEVRVTRTPDQPGGWSFLYCPGRGG